MTNKKNDINYHEILKQASGYSYRDSIPIPEGYKNLNSIDNKDTGFHAEIIVKGNDFIIAYRGTDNLLGIDGRNDLAMARKKFPEQATEAIQVYDKLKQDYPNSDITVTGHSLGGSLSQIVSSIRGCNAVTFNAYGTKDMFEDPYNIKEDNIVNYVNEWDPITMSNAENHVGETYAVKGEKRRNPHNIETMANLKTREYRTPENLKDHKNIFNRIENKVEYTTSIIKEKTEDTFTKIKEYVTDNEYVKKYSNTCVGSYPVSSYTRSDGTKVRSYTRTCGAKHIR